MTTLVSSMPGRPRFHPNILAAMTATLPAASSGSSSVRHDRVHDGGREGPADHVAVTPYYQRGRRRSTSRPGLAIRRRPTTRARNPKVSLLFSDPIGTGLDAAWCWSRALRRWTTATSTPTASATGASRREAARDQDCIRRSHAGLFNWYYTRLYVDVRPERVYVWPDGDLTSEPELLDSHMEEVRSGARRGARGGVARSRGRRACGTGGWTSSGDRYGTASCRSSARTASRSPAAVPIELDRGRAASAARQAADWLPPPGPACLAAHEHDADSLAAELPGPRRPRGGAAAGRSCRTGWSAGSSCPGQGSGLPRELLEDAALRKRAQARTGPPRRRTGPALSRVASAGLYGVKIPCRTNTVLSCVSTSPSGPPS